MVETRPRWFGHLKRIPVDSVLLRETEVDLEKSIREIWYYMIEHDDLV